MWPLIRFYDLQYRLPHVRNLLWQLLIACSEGHMQLQMPKWRTCTDQEHTSLETQHNWYTLHLAQSFHRLSFLHSSRSFPGGWITYPTEQPHFFPRFHFHFFFVFSWITVHFLHQHRLQISHLLFLCLQEKIRQTRCTNVVKYVCQAATHAAKIQSEIKAGCMHMLKKGDPCFLRYISKTYKILWL